MRLGGNLMGIKGVILDCGGRCIVHLPNFSLNPLSWPFPPARSSGQKNYWNDADFGRLCQKL